MARMTVKNQGELLQFLSAGDANISSCKVYFSPKQSGEGTPSPENVRPIEGWSGVEVTHCGKNLFSNETPYRDIGRDMNNRITSKEELLQGISSKQMIFYGLGYGSENSLYYSANNQVWIIIPVHKNATYAINNYVKDKIRLFDKDFTAIDSVNCVNRGAIVTIPNNTEIKYMGFYVHNYAQSYSQNPWTIDDVFKKLQIELASTPTSFEPYQSHAEKELPSEYQRVEYIESTGTQYIQTLYTPQNTDEITCDFSIIGSIEGLSNSQALFSAGTGTTQLIFLLCNYNRNNSVNGAYYKYFASGVAKPFNFYPSYNSKYLLTISGNGIASCNGYSIRSPYEGAVNTSLRLMRRVNDASSFVGRLYNFVLSNSGNKRLNLVPCLRRSDSKPGMYDTVSQTFYVNQGTGEFIAGPAVNRYDIDWSEDLGTIYGGYVDLVRGELVETDYCQKVTNTGYTKYSKNYDTTEDSIYFQIRPTYPFITIDRNGIVQTDRLINGLPKNGMCDGLSVLGIDNWRGTQYINTLTSSYGLDTFSIRMSNIFGVTSEDSETDKATKINNYFAQNPIYISYALTTPITHQLSPAILTTLTGSNTFWSNADYIEIEYDLIETQEIMDVRKRIIGSSPHLETAGGQFNTDMAAPLKSCRISFSPIQEGEGDPSPSNVRPIKGWDGITVTRCGKNLYPYSQGSTAAYQPIFLKVNTEYVFSCNTETAPYARVRYIDGTVSPIIWLRNDINGIKYASFTPALDADGAFIFRGDGLTNPMIELGSVPTEYEPYTETSITIPFPQTIYGGYVDLVKGKIVETWKESTLEALNWVGSGNRARTNNSIGASVPSYTDTPDLIAEKYYAASYSTNLTNYPNAIALGSAGFITYYDGETLPSGRFVYKLATPLTYSINPQTLRTLRGLNNVFTDANGSVELTYWTH